MKALLVIILASLQLVSARALTADRFELHAVANTAGERTREYSTTADGDIPARTVHLDRTVLLDGTAVQTLTFIPAHDGTPLYLHIEFTLEGKQRFAELTTQYLNQRLGVVVDGHLINAPNVRGTIYGGSIDMGKDPHEFPYPNFWLPLMHPDTPTPSPFPVAKKQP